MAKNPKQKEIIQTAVLGGSAGAGIFFGKGTNGYFPEKQEDKQKSAGLKVLTGLAVFGLTAFASANMADGLANKAVVGLGAGFGGEKLVSAASDYISTTDLLQPKKDDAGNVIADPVKDFLSAGLKGAESTCGCNSLSQRTAYPALNFPVIPMVETSGNVFEANMDTLLS